MAESITLDQIDRGLVHALTIDGRVPFSLVGELLGVSEHTVARRYRRLRAYGVLRVVGVVNGLRLGRRSWTIRIRCTPEAAGPIATALARRADTYWIHILSGGTEISCNCQPASDEQLLIDKLPRSVDVTAHELLPGSTRPPRWAAIEQLSVAQTARLQRPEPTDEEIVLEPPDHQLLQHLAVDGRATYAQLAPVTGWSTSTVARRLDQLRRTGVLGFEVELPPSALGYRAEARLWMSVRPTDLVETVDVLTEHPEISFTAVTTGPTNLVAHTICRDSAHLYRYLTERIGALPGINTLETAPVLRTIKAFQTPLP
ncbi:AsnC family transcriptional regulator [Kribbella sp. NPDC051952]|uniref:Lrp/AsnC family transcriptional regulator n=1 Tax=Kribbella sp. NPDC051952 TaxID=3154851 RepID=UPI00341CFEFC